MTESDLGDLINQVDTDGDGRLTFAELVELVQQPATLLVLRDAPSEQQVEAFFSVFDRNKDGHVDAAELMDVLSTMGEPLSSSDVHSIRQEMSNAELIDGDQRVNIHCFVQRMIATS